MDTRVHRGKQKMKKNKVQMLLVGGYTNLYVCVFFFHHHQIKLCDGCMPEYLHKMNLRKIFNKFCLLFMATYRARTKNFRKACW